MVVTSKGLFLFILYVIIPSFLSYLYLPSHLFLSALFIIVLIGSCITYFYSKIQEEDTRLFDELINSKDNFEDYMNTIEGNKYSKLFTEYKKNKKYIIENNSEIIIYPVENAYNLLNIFQELDFLKLPSLKHNRHLIKINGKGIEYRGNKFIKWENLISIKYDFISTGQSKIQTLNIKSFDNDSIIIPFEYSGLPLRQDNLKMKLDKFMQKENIRKLLINYKCKQKKV